MKRPKAIAFDVVETLFSLESLRPRLISAGLASHHLETWFASFLRDAFAMEITGEYKPFREIASANLSVLLKKEHDRADSDAVEHVLDGFAELEPHDDVAPAMQALQSAGVRIATLFPAPGGSTGCTIISAVSFWRVQNLP